ncbi:MAG: class I tRNA ligase family protein [Anaeroplasmataceae bacterium]|nr:class I tRNA ligase family protein [Anaeroplasmataceae bacterium]
MKHDYQYWTEKWNKGKIFRVENDRIKKKSYIFSAFPKTNLYGFQDAGFRSLLACDFYARYERMKGFNVLFPTGFDSLGLSAFIENKKHNTAMQQDIAGIFDEQMKMLGIGMDEQKKIDLKQSDYLTSLQLSFVELYERGYIHYDWIDVYQDSSKKKIFDSYFYKEQLVPNKVKAFYLDISSIKNEVINKINDLPCSLEQKKEVLEMLSPKEILQMNFAVTNGAKLSVELTEPQYLGGLSFILIHPDYIDISLYTLYEEYQAIELYLSDDNANDFGVFSGTYAINPLTGKKIPIFISVKYDQPVYLANPFLNPLDRITAKEEGLPIVDVVQNGVFIESDFLNGMKETEGRLAIIQSFIEADMCQCKKIYTKDKILLSSLDSLGALIPFLKDNEDHIYSLKRYLPFVFSAKLRPILDEDIDVPGNIIPGSINHIFSTGMIPILSMLYDDIGAVVSIFSKEALLLFKSWLPMKFMAIHKEEQFESIFFPLCILTIIEKEKGVQLPPLFNQVMLDTFVCDESGKPLLRSNRNLLDISKSLEHNHGDAFRLYFLSKPIEQSFLYSNLELESLHNLIKAIEDSYHRGFVEKNQLDSVFSEFIKEEEQYLQDLNISSYTINLISFFKAHLYKNQMTVKQGKLFLKLLYLVCPFLSDDLYESVYKSKYLLNDDGWIN